MKQGMPDVPSWSAWLKELGPTTRVGIDPHVLSAADAKPLSEALAKDPTRSLVPVNENLVDLVWGQGRPPRPSNPIFRLGDEYAGESVGSKLSKLRENLTKTGSPGTVITNLDEVAWLFNLRGSDIPYNPVFFAYAIVTRDDATLYVNPASVPQDVRDYLSQNNVAVLEYDKVWPALASWRRLIEEQKAAEKAKAEAEAAADQERKDKLPTPEPPKPEPAANGAGPKEKVQKTDKVLIGRKTSWAVANALGDENVEARRSWVEDAKARKNAVEIEGFRRSHVRDGAALVRYFAWLEEALGKGEKINEFDAATQLEKFRGENKLFKGLSFDTISSTGANAAIIHYKPDEENSAVIDVNQVYLCDSGGQYMDGTTDVTRTLVS